MKIDPRQLRDFVIMILGLLFLFAGTRIITRYIEQFGPGRGQRVYVQAAPFVKDMLDPELARDTYRMIMRRARVEDVLVQTPATLSDDLLDNLGSEAMRRQYGGILDSLSRIFVSIQTKFGFTYRPFSGWRLRMRRDRDTFFTRLHNEPALQVAMDEYRQVHRRISREVAARVPDIPFFRYNTALYDSLRQVESTAFNTLFADVIKDTGGYERNNAAFLEWIDTELDRDPELPLLILYDATQAHHLIKFLEDRKNVYILRPSEKAGWSIFGRWKYLLGQ